MGIILVVEDDVPIQHAISRVLTRRGHVVRMAADGADALDKVQGILPDLIILDVYLPVLDGRAFVAAYRQRPGRQAPILLMTAMGHAAQRALALDAAGHLDKPFLPSELLAEVDRLLGPPASAPAGEPIQ